MTTLIILLLIMIVIGTCKNDYSLIIGLGKIILYGAVIFGILFIGALAIEVPALSVLFIGGVIIFLVYTFGNNKKESLINNTDDSNNSTIKQEENDIKIESSQVIDKSEFQKELEANTKTHQQVEDEKWLKEKDYIKQTAEKDYNYIKNGLLEKAKNAEYITINQNKQIIYKYKCSFLLSCVHREHFYNPTGRRGTSSYRSNKKVSYSINKINQYDFYLSTIKELALKDNISINPFFVELDPVVYQKENRINLPYTYAHEWRTTSHEIKAYLKCTIQY